MLLAELLPQHLQVEMVRDVVILENLVTVRFQVIVIEEQEILDLVTVARGRLAAVYQKYLHPQRIPLLVTNVKMVTAQVT